MMKRRAEKRALEETTLMAAVNECDDRPLPA